MEVVCLILGPKLASQPRLLAFWVLTSLHLLSFLLKMFFIILVYIDLTDRGTWGPKNHCSADIYSAIDMHTIIVLLCLYNSKIFGAVIY